MRRALPALVLSLALAACGPKTIVSSLFPTRYAVTTVLDFNDNGRVSRQTVVTACKVVDQTDSIAANTNTDVTGERHWIRRADGSLWLVGLLDACRWGPKGPRGDHAFRPLSATYDYAQPDRSWPVPPSYSYRYDDPARPTQVEIYETRRLFGDGAQGLRLTGRLAAAGETPTDTLRAAFPFLASVDAHAKAARAKAKNQPSGYRDYSTSPGAFVGFAATAVQLSHGACPTPDPGAEGPVPLEPTAECQYADPCRADRASEQLCSTSLGGLKPEFTPSFDRVSFTLADRELGFVQRLPRAELVQAAGAPRHAPARFEWNPQLCVDGRCLRLERLSGGAVLYYPKRNVVVTLRPAGHHARGELFLAEDAPVWSGTD